MRLKQGPEIPFTYHKLPLISPELIQLCKGY